MRKDLPRVTQLMSVLEPESGHLTLDPVVFQLHAPLPDLRLPGLITALSVMLNILIFCFGGNPSSW